MPKPDVWTPNRRTLLKGSAALAGLFAASPLLAACGGGDSGMQQLRLTTDENDPDTVKFYESVIASFTELHQDIDVDLVITATTPLQKQLSAFATGADMGVFVPVDDRIASWAKEGYLLPLNDMINEIGADDFLPGTRFVMDGNDYTMPYQNNSMVFWYRKDLFDQAGLPIPTSYDELLNAAKELTRDNMYGIGLPIGTAEAITANWLVPFIYQSGWDYFDREGNITFDQPEVRDAVKRYTDLAAYSPPSLRGSALQRDCIDAYVSGRVAIGVYVGRMGLSLAKDAPQIAANTVVGNMPVGPFMTGQLHRGSRNDYAIHKATKMPKESMDFLKYMTTGQNGLDFSLVLAGHALSPLKSVLDQTLTAPNEYVIDHQDWLKPMIDNLPNTMAPFRDMGSVNNGTFERINNPMPWAAEALGGDAPIDGLMMQKIALKGESVDSAWQEAASQLKSVSETWKKENPDWVPAG